MAGVGIILLVSGASLWVTGFVMLRLVWKLKVLADTRAAAAEETLNRAKEESKKMMEAAELDIKRRFNQIAMLSPDELYLYVSHRFNMCLETAARTDVADGEWHREAKLFEKAYLRLAVDNNDDGIIAAIGADTIDAIDARYGHNYLQRICDQYYRWLIARGAIPKLLNREIGVIELDRMVDSGAKKEK